MKFSHAAALWVDYRERLVEFSRLAHSTFTNQSKIVAAWTAHLGALELDEIRKSHVELAVGALAQSRKPGTLRGDVALLAQILNWCVDEGHLAARPRLPTISVPNIEDDLPSDEAFTWAIEHVSPQRHRDSLEFMLLTGLAPHECARLQPEDFDEGRGAVGIGQREDFAVKTASRRRWVPLNARARVLWASAPFPSVAATEKALQRARGPGMPKGANLITPKMMRKWFSSKLAGDVAEHVLQRLLGHAPGSKITRRHYVRSRQTDAEDAVASLEIPVME